MTIATDLPALVLDTIRRHDLLGGGETVLVAVSGGADSTALLDVLDELRGPLALTLEVAHVHHGLRPEADAEAARVEALCAERGLPYHIARVEVRRAGPGADWAGLEAAARQRRYAALREIAAEVGAARIATGHTADDQAETVLMRLLEGAGPGGLAGIPPRRGALVRPLLACRRAEIEAYLRARGMRWTEDGSNRDPAFLRNRLRHDVLPWLATALDRDIVDHLARGAAVARAAVADVERRAAEALAAAADADGSALVVDVARLATLPDDVSLAVLRLALARCGHRGPLRGPAVRALAAVLAAPRARPVRVGALRVERSGSRLRVGIAPLPSLVTRQWDGQGELALPEAGLSLRAVHRSRPVDWVPPRDPRHAVFDADRLPAALVVRARRRGDRIAPLGGPQWRRLKTLLIDGAVPRWERARVPILEAAGEILWVAGVRRGRAAPVTAATARLWEVTLVHRDAAADAADGVPAAASVSRK